MRFQLMAVGVEEVERITFAPVLLPQRNIPFTQTLRKSTEMPLLDGECVVRVVALQVHRTHFVQ